MGIISPDKIDLFFSYGRDDDRAYAGRIKEVYSVLKEKYEARLSIRSQEAPQLVSLGHAGVEFFWDDTGLPPNGDLQFELIRKVKASEFLFICVGDAYLKSEWCGKEVEVFAETHGNRWNEIVNRIFVLVLSSSAKKKKWHQFSEERSRPIFHEFYEEDDKPLRRYIGGKLNSRYEDLLDRIADQLVIRTLEVMKLDVSFPEPRASDGGLEGSERPLPPVERRDVTIGLVTQDLEQSRDQLVKLLVVKGITVHRLDLAEVSGVDENDDETLATIREKLTRSRVFVQPYSSAKVLLPRFGAGGHLACQQAMIAPLQTIWWRVAEADGGITDGQPKAVTRAEDLEYFSRLCANANSAEAARARVLDLLTPSRAPDSGMGRVFVESSEHDEETLRLLKEDLDKLWQDHFGPDSPLIIWSPVPWVELMRNGEKVIEVTDGVILLYANKDFLALEAQVAKILQLRHELGRRLRRRPNLGIAVAVVIPPKEWTGQVAAWQSFPYKRDRNGFSVDKTRVLPFLSAVHASIRKRATGEV